MAIISKIEAQTFRGRAMHAGIILVLCIGGLSMIYPFLIMASGALRSEMDETDLDMVPQYLVNEEVLYRKFIETKYNQDVVLANRAHKLQSFDFRGFVVPGEVSHHKVEDLLEFLKEQAIPQHWELLGGTVGVQTVPENLRELRNRLQRRFNDSIVAFNQEVGAPITGWNTIVMRAPDWLDPQYDYADNTLHQIYFEMQQEAPWAERHLVSISGHFLQHMIYPTYGQLSTEGYNAAHERPLESFHEFVLPPRVPDESEPTLREEWIQFAREELNPSFTVLEGLTAADFVTFLNTKYPTIDDLNRNWAMDYGSFNEVELPSGQWLQGAKRQDYLEFLREQPPEAYRLIGPEYTLREWLERRYGSIEQLNAAWHTDYDSYSQVHVPMDHLELDHVLANAGSLRRTYAARNFINVSMEIFLRGRAFINTVIFCTLAVVSALLINPMAAYAMSRFQLPGTYKFLLLLMATISFPPMVTTIPQFIMMRELNMLNTFAALVLPGVANGYLIFLLKGFFDSLPRELYEAATIDGASEIRIFFQITMSLSKPILAVVGLAAFNAAYGTFLYALIVAPRQDMWVLNVWLYQWRDFSSSGGVFASVIIASIPTLLVFLLAQKIIIRGIVVPVEK
jgi:ABC-type glycerol-3-phosphate transport system permease component